MLVINKLLISYGIFSNSALHIKCVMGENPPTVYRALTGIIFTQRYVPGGKQQNAFQEGPSCYQKGVLGGELISFPNGRG